MRQSGLQRAAHELNLAGCRRFVPPAYDAPQSTLTECRFLQPTLTRIAEDCGRVCGGFPPTAPQSALENDTIGARIKKG